MYQFHSHMMEFFQSFAMMWSSEKKRHIIFVCSLNTAHKSKGILSCFSHQHDTAKLSLQGKHYTEYTSANRFVTVTNENARSKGAENGRLGREVGTWSGRVNKQEKTLQQTTLLSLRYWAKSSWQCLTKRLSLFLRAAKLVHYSKFRGIAFLK